MALVLAIDSSHRHEQAIERLTRELTRHNIVVAGSCDEALDLLAQSIPDLIVFPLSLASDEERSLANRLRVLPARDPVQTLVLPLLAFDEAEQSSDDSPAESRWFFWRKPPDDEDGTASVEARRFAREVRAAVRRARTLKARRDRAERVRNSLPSPTTVLAAGGALGSGIVRVIGLRLRAIAAGLGKAASFCRRALAPSLVSAAGTGGRLFGIGAAGAWKLAKRAGSIELPGTRPLWYGAPVVVLGLGVTAAVGIPRAKMWLATRTGVGVVNLRSIPDGSEVFIDGRKIGETPLTAPISAGKHEVDFRYAGATKTSTLEIGIGEHAELNVDWKRGPVGHLRVSSDPDGAAVTIDGTKRGFTPVTIDDLSPGQHVVTLQLASGLVRRVVKIKPNETALVSQSIYSGWLALFAPVELQLTEGGRRLRLDEHSQVMLSPGRHDLQLANAAIGYIESKIVEIQPGEVTAVTISIPRTSVTVTASSAAEVWLDGVRLGETPLVDTPIDVGTREFVLKSPTLGERRVMTTVTVKPSRINVDFSKPEL